MIEPYALILVALASYRLARLVALDGITEPVRGWLVEHGPEPLVELWSCPFCVSVYVGAGSLAAWQAGSVGRWLVTIAAVMGLAALPFELANALSDDD